MTEELSLETQINSIWNHVKGFHVVHFIYTGHELGLFSKILNNASLAVLVVGRALILLSFGM